ncbi:stealth family protein [Actinobacillus genomosp. 2]|uniref:stealth family protein n=1 Tax=Actinobacillus genomosp. 2 TaxID=230709 RepID=UPI002443336E|nr:stealth family protein [Actinobacillus genomosp. 2]WGE31757.1 stealth family protein [Actinobacillus genomosp. 2]
MNRKFSKLLKRPHIFFRDFLNKKYPIKNTELPFSESEESSLIEAGKKLDKIIQKNTYHQSDIDVVFTWVDGSDPLWQSKYNQYVPVYQAKSALYATDRARFEDHNELYYSVHSVLKFMPWVRHVFIVTDNQRPKWLDGSYQDKITLISHQDIIDPEYLPTFNSHVIEAFLHKIPNLSENFIYFNDDVFVARELQAEHFFQVNGIASIFISEKSLVKMREKGTITPTLSASERSIRLLNKYYNTNIDSPLVHTYIPLKKSMYELAWERYKQEILEFLPNKLRTNRDLNFANFLIPWLMYFEGKATSRMDICYYFNIRSPNAISLYRKLLLKKSTGDEPHSFCANDFNSKKAIENYQEKLILMLSEYYKL